MHTTSKPRGPFGRLAILAATVGWLTLALATAAGASQPWENDPLGVIGYNGYQGVASHYDLDSMYQQTNDDGALAWGESYVLDTFLSMYRGTRDTSYLDRLVQHFDVVLTHRDDVRGVTDEFRGAILPAWSSTKYSDGVRYAYAGHAGLITDPAAKFVDLVKTTPSLSAAYGAKAQQYETAIMQTVDAFDADWRTSGSGGYYYMPSSLNNGRVIYNLQVGAMGRTLVNLWQSSGQAKYLSKATATANYFKSKLTTVTEDGVSHYTWNYSSGTNGSPEDISHAWIDVDFAYQCYQAGIVFTATDIQRFANTLKDISLGADGFAHSVDGTGAADPAYSRMAGVWLELGYVDPSVRQVVGDYLGVYGEASSHWLNDIPDALGGAYLVATSPVPEPGALVLLGTAAAGLWAGRRWQRRRSNVR
jgi:hypothetical protein